MARVPPGEIVPPLARTFWETMAPGTAEELARVAPGEMVRVEPVPVAFPLVSAMDKVPADTVSLPL